MENKTLEVFKQTVIIVNNDYIPVMPLCDFFGISYKRSAEKIRNDEILKSEWSKMSSETLFGDNRERFCITKKGFIRWVQIINAGILRPELRQKFIEFQSNIFEFLYSGASNKTTYLEDMCALNNDAMQLRSERGRLGARIQKINTVLRTMQELGPDEWQNSRQYYLNYAIVQPQLPL